ncbi:MAG: hypothetical protein HYW89_03715 [Candidatus Sungiibacteriota bacterium]|uniref:Uncharacterized protein n=1 Tax=Candidatus Sungiibacteriota bacterium TaxID=2750080 RepID=A0A7T5UR40_9BACT|nr:MAG: hypothetical protein HYW89_03715 [Candidatus Sungbacteria bacterium]
MLLQENNVPFGLHGFHIISLNEKHLDHLPQKAAEYLEKRKAKGTVRIYALGQRIGIRRVVTEEEAEKLLKKFSLRHWRPNPKKAIKWPSE